MSESRDAIRQSVATLVREVIGEEWADDIDFTDATSFSDDLELESIEFVALAESVQERYGERVDFVAWLSEMELDAIIALTVGDLVEFISKRLEG